MNAAAAARQDGSMMEMRWMRPRQLDDEDEMRPTDDNDGRVVEVQPNRHTNTRWLVHG